MAHSPTLTTAFQQTLDLRRRAAECGLFSTQAPGKLRKLVSESRELIEALAGSDQAHIRDEASDITFVWATVIGDLGIAPEAALQMAQPILAAPNKSGLSPTQELNALISHAHVLTEALAAADERQIDYGTRRVTETWARIIRGLAMDPCELMQAANNKFARRFGYVMNEMTVRGITPTLEQRPLMLRLWDEAKRLEKLTP